MGEELLIWREGRGAGETRRMKEGRGRRSSAVAPEFRKSRFVCDWFQWGSQVVSLTLKAAESWLA